MRGRVGEAVAADRAAGVRNLCRRGALGDGRSPEVGRASFPESSVCFFFK